MKELDTIGKELSRHVKTQKDLTEVIGHLSKTMQREYSQCRVG